MAPQDCLAFNQARQAQERQVLRRELAVLSPRHLLTYRKSMTLSTLLAMFRNPQVIFFAGHRHIPKHADLAISLQ